MCDGIGFKHYHPGYFSRIKQGYVPQNTTHIVVQTTLPAGIFLINFVFTQLLAGEGNEKTNLIQSTSNIF